MKPETWVQLARLAWFVLLAIAEVIWASQGREQDKRTGDARLLTNFGLTALILAASALLPVARITSSDLAGRLHLGVANLVQLPWLAAFALLLIVDSLAAYWVHRLMHATPVLWRVHRVHHADTAVDVSTSLRNHPLELLATVPVASLVVLLTGAPVSVVLGVQAAGIAAAIWQHADISLPARVDRALATTIFTPRLHRLHHNPERAVHDSNFGETIVLWDWLFGTLNRGEGRRPVGLKGQSLRPDHLLDQIWSPLFADRSASGATPAGP
jgi:sterol desaturase/sphingolipid hydroxylase (fatty acid hydroxylase superfamily)